ncbi:MAG: aminoglycoside phosphotransferase family protein [Chloroflexota bacterium]|jgi:aminoglycoside phosphotransferase (APT) family kinase protein
MMHAGEVAIEATLVRRLLAGQFPQWADEPITAVDSAGTDNALFRLGDGKVVRLPRIHWAVDQVDKERQWLPELAPHLPLAVPRPLAIGTPGEGYPWPWSISTWLDGENATLDRLVDPQRAAGDLAAFIRALQTISTTGAPAPSDSDRGVLLAVRDAPIRAALDHLRDLAARGIVLIDTDRATAVWDSVLADPPWSGPPVWLHGDLQSGNLLARGGRLSAVIDFGCLAIGDPACDLQPAWNLFTGDSRAAFREAMGVDNRAWARGRGWALSVGLIALPYYYQTNPVLAGIARQTIVAVLADHGPLMKQ